MWPLFWGEALIHKDGKQTLTRSGNGESKHRMNDWEGNALTGDKFLTFRSSLVTGSEM